MTSRVFSRSQLNAFPSFVALLSVECDVFDPIPKSRPAFSQIATSGTEYPLPSAIREFKRATLQLSILRLHLFLILPSFFFGDGRSRFPS
ncbi:hypothetical protein AVEN_129614-1 [Araneus ventricosus]|uniref:Uncharacterized protein n=1 Tax=Araneus ventricosus TaxID=182803 RepID=A0A4Y2J869_ARAVE|nr:hypothetical protein AVEN_129614-1 [Araneus ventricosus]